MMMLCMSSPAKKYSVEHGFSGCGTLIAWNDVDALPTRRKSRSGSVTPERCQDGVKRTFNPVEGGGRVVLDLREWFMINCSTALQEEMCDTEHFDRHDKFYYRILTFRWQDPG